MTSAKTGKGDIFTFILGLLNSKYKDISIQNRNKNIKDYVNFYKSNNDKLNSLIRCDICKANILKLKLHENIDRIELECKLNQKEKQFSCYKDIINLNNNKIKCHICQKQFKEKSDDSIISFKKDNYLLCKKCNNKKTKYPEEDIISPYYVYDQLCKNHLIINDLYCQNCKILICSLCSNSHINHNIKQLDNNFIKQLVKEKKDLIKLEKEQYDILNKYLLDLIESLKTIYNNFMDLKNLQLKLKEDIVNQFELIKFNNELFESVIKMDFPKLETKININPELSIFKKLTFFFDYINQPIKIIKLNICNDYNQTKFNFNCNNGQSESLKPNDSITDGCNLNNDCCCISFDNGSLQIYNKLNMESFQKSYKIYEDKKGISSMINYNENNILVSGWENIYELKIDNDLSLEKKIIIKKDNIIFKKLCNYIINNSILFTDNLGNIHIYNFNDKVQSKININKDNQGIFDIYDFSNIEKNIFYIKYKILDINIDIDNNTIADINENTIIENQKDFSIIFNLKGNNEVSKIYSIPGNYQIIDKINKEYILAQINEKDNSKFIIYNYINDTKLYINNPYLNLSNSWVYKTIEKNKINHIFYFLLIGPNLDIIEFLFNQKNNKIQQIGLIMNDEKIKYTNNKILTKIIFKNSLIIINNNNESYLLNY